MAVIADIFGSYYKPQQVMQNLLSSPPREDRALALVFGGCLSLFLMQIPSLAVSTDGADMPRVLSYAFMVSVMFLPLVFYVLAAAVHIIARIFGGRGTWYSARMAVFWAVVSIAPIALIWGLAKGAMGDALLTQILGWAGCAAFIWVFASSIWVAER